MEKHQVQANNSFKTCSTSISLYCNYVDDQYSLCWQWCLRWRTIISAQMWMNTWLMNKTGTIHRTRQGWPCFSWWGKSPRSCFNERSSVCKVNKNRKQCIVNSLNVMFNLKKSKNSIWNLEAQKPYCLFFLIQQREFENKRLLTEEPICSFKLEEGLLHVDSCYSVYDYTGPGMLLSMLSAHIFEFHLLWRSQQWVYF